jgi:predicted transcriptional regulator/ubiquinone/menaquinone biosynthesis C-methylase UbiE
MTLTTHEDAARPPRTPSEEMLNLFQSRRTTQGIYVVTQLGIPDMLKDGPRTVDDLAKESKTNTGSLSRLIRALASVGVFSQDEDGLISLTELGETLRSDVEDSLRSHVLMVMSDEFDRALRDLIHSIKTGETAFDHVYGMTDWEYRAKHKESGTIFNLNMARQARTVAKMLVESYSFANMNTIVDVGGGDGSLLIGILNANPNLQGIVYDLPQTGEDARTKISLAGLASRCKVLEGDALKSVPSGADAYILSRVIHDWNDAKSIQILTNCNKAMSEGGKILLLERVVPQTRTIERYEALKTVFFSDLTMMVMNGGRERSEDEFRSLFEASGFKLSQVKPIASGTNIIEGIKSL